MKLIVAFLRLSRLKVILRDYFWALAILGIIAAQGNITTENIALGLLITLSVQAYAFIVNDCEDAEDDARDPKKAKRNPISAEFISYRQGILILQTTSFPALILAFLISGWIGFFIILSALILGHLYSWKKIRFKSRPFIDLVSHCFALAMFHILYSMVLPGAQISIGSMFILYGSGLFSAGGALYNQLRDWEVDQLAQLKNTTHVIGKVWSKRLLITLYFLGIMFITVGVLERLNIIL